MDGENFDEIRDIEDYLEFLSLGDDLSEILNKKYKYY